jgi:methionyl-tRNA synthetase
VGVRAALEKTRGEVDEAMEEFAFQGALTAIWEFISAINRYVDVTAPWALATDPQKQDRLHTVLYTLGEALRCLSIILTPFLPTAAETIREFIGQRGAPVRLADLVWGRLAPGTNVRKATALFPRVAEKREGGRVAKGEPVTDATRITIDEFSQVDLRIAEVLAAERVEKSKRLLKLTVEIGEETRTMVAGIAEHYDPASLVGKKVVVVANLEPATLMGVESQGMVLAASEGGVLSLVTLEKDLPSGSKVK